MILWRDTVTAGEFSVAYSKTGEAWGDYRLQMPDGSFWALPSCSPSVGASTQFDDLYCRQFMVPVAVPAGVYPLSRGVPGQYYDAGTIAVLAKPAAKEVSYIQPGDNWQQVQFAIDAGKEVRLLPGLHVWANQIYLREGSIIRGTHRDLTVVKRLYQIPNHAQFSRVFTIPTASTGNFIISDLTIEPDPSCPLTPVLFHAYPGDPRNATIQRCRSIELGGISSGAVGWLIDDCIFDRCAFSGYGAMFRNCVWQGFGRRYANISGGLAVGTELTVSGNSWVFDSVFDRTGRGINISGPGNTVVIGALFRDIASLVNKNEVINLESSTGPVESIYLSHMRVNNCHGPTLMFNQGACGQLVVEDLKVWGGGALCFNDDSPTKAVLRRCELENCVVWSGNGSDVTFPANGEHTYLFWNGGRALNQVTNDHVWMPERHPFDGPGVKNAAGLRVIRPDSGSVPDLTGDVLDIRSKLAAVKNVL